MTDPDADMQSLLETGEPEFELIMSCVFGIEAHETRTYLTLLERPGSTAEELAAALDRDRSNVNRSLTALLEKGLVERERRLLDPGGYVYQYTAVPLPEAKAMLRDALEAWTETVHEVIEAYEPGTETSAEDSDASAEE